MTAEEALARIVSSTLGKREALAEARRHNEVRAAAVREYRELAPRQRGRLRTKVQIAEDIKVALIAAGVPADEIKGLGLSHDSIRNILEA